VAGAREMMSALTVPLRDRCGAGSAQARGYRRRNAGSISAASISSSDGGCPCRSIRWSLFRADSIAELASRDEEKSRPAADFLRATALRVRRSVNPGHDSIGTCRAIGRGPDRPPVDLGRRHLPAHAVLPRWRCAAAGVRPAIVISSGFAEEGGPGDTRRRSRPGRRNRHALRDERGGFYNEAQRIAPTFSPTAM